MATALDFEKPILEIQEKIEELKKMSLESGTWKTGVSIWRMMEGLMDTIFQAEKRNKERKI